MTTACIIQARTGSTRLPGKVLFPICGKSMLERVVNRVRLSTEVDRIIVATSDLERDDAIEDECERIKVDWYRGSEEDVLARYVGAAAAFKLSDEDAIVRVTADCPFIDPGVLNALVRLWRDNQEALVTNNAPPSFPHGLDAEVFSLALAKKAAEHGPDEHVTQWMRSGAPIVNLVSPAQLSNVRLTVDTREDMTAARAIYAALGARKKSFATSDVIWLLERRPDLRERCVSEVVEVGN